MPLKFKEIYFDLDGTLVDSLKGIENGLRFSFKKLKGRELTNIEVKKMIGIPLYQSLKAHCSSDQQIEEIVKSFRFYYEEKGIFESRLFPGIKNLLIDLSKESKLFVVTAKPTKYAQTVLDFHGILSCFNTVSGSSLENHHFNKADFLMGCSDVNSSIMIGDKNQDIDAGKKAKILTCGVLWGYGTKEELENSAPDFIVSSTQKLTSLLFIK